MTAKRAKARTESRGHEADETPEEPKAPVPKWRLVNRVELAELIGVHPETITNYARQGMPCHAVGKRGQESTYDSVACLKWWRQEHGKLSAKEIAQTRAYEATAKLNELKLALQRADLLPRDQVISEGQAFVKGWTSQVRSLPRRARQSGIVTTPDQEAALMDLCRQILIDISGWTTTGDAERKGAAA